MRTKSSFWTFALLFLGWNAQSQPFPANGPNAGTGINVTDHQLMLGAKRAVNGAADEIIEGTPYLTDEFLKADVYGKGGKFTSIPVRYNIYEDYVEFRQKDVTYILDPGPDIRKVDVGGYCFVVEKSKVKGKMKPGYFIRLDSGKVTILLKKTVTLKAAQEPKAFESGSHPAQYLTPQDEYMYKIGDGPLLELSSVKKLIEALPDKQEEMKSFVSIEKISKNEQELTKFAKYYNSL